jgi:Ser/Thr protein kinase RdoA (MazF antagonist)
MSEREKLDRLAREALRHYDLSPEATVELINVSENSTYRVDDPPTGRRVALRVHRLGYHDAAEIESELAWIDALREEGVVGTPIAIASRSGARVVAVSTPELAEPRNVVLFDWLNGIAPTAEDVPSFRRLGVITARLHAHSRRWTRPPGFSRFTWDYETTIGQNSRWGRWQDGLGVGPAERRLLDRLDCTIRARLADFGKSPERFGLVHADLRLANLMVDGDRPIVIDFDDSGLSWFMYDWGTAVSFIEHLPHVPELQAAWVEGYRTIATLPGEDERELQTFVMLRRLLLIAWVGSHHTYAPEAAALGADFTYGTSDLAERYLSKLA